VPQRQSKSKGKKAEPKPAPRYKSVCDAHPDRRAAYSFVDKSDPKSKHYGKLRGLCQECYDEEREEGLRQLRRRERIKRIRAKRESNNAKR